MTARVRRCGLILRQRRQPAVAVSKRPEHAEHATPEPESSIHDLQAEQRRQGPTFACTAPRTSCTLPDVQQRFATVAVSSTSSSSSTDTVTSHDTQQTCKANSVRGALKNYSSKQAVCLCDILGGYLWIKMETIDYAIMEALQVMESYSSPLEDISLVLAGEESEDGDSSGTGSMEAHPWVNMDMIDDQVMAENLQESQDTESSSLLKDFSPMQLAGEEAEDDNSNGTPGSMEAHPSIKIETIDDAVMENLLETESSSLLKDVSPMQFDPQQEFGGDNSSSGTGSMEAHLGGGDTGEDSVTDDPSCPSCILDSEDAAENSMEQAAVVRRNLSSVNALNKDKDSGDVSAVMPKQQSLSYSQTSADLAAPEPPLTWISGMEAARFKESLYLPPTTSSRETLDADELRVLDRSSCGVLSVAAEAPPISRCLRAEEHWAVDDLFKLPDLLAANPNEVIPYRKKVPSLTEVPPPSEPMPPACIAPASPAHVLLGPPLSSPPRESQTGSPSNPPQTPPPFARSWLSGLTSLVGHREAAHVEKMSISKATDLKKSTVNGSTSQVDWSPMESEQREQEEEETEETSDYVNAREEEKGCAVRHMRDSNGNPLIIDLTEYSTDSSDEDEDTPRAMVVLSSDQALLRSNLLNLLGKAVGNMRTMAHSNNADPPEQNTANTVLPAQNSLPHELLACGSKRKSTARWILGLDVTRNNSSSSAVILSDKPLPSNRTHPSRTLSISSFKGSMSIGEPSSAASAQPAPDVQLRNPTVCYMKPNIKPTTAVDGDHMKPATVTALLDIPRLCAPQPPTTHPINNTIPAASNVGSPSISTTRPPIPEGSNFFILPTGCYTPALNVQSTDTDKSSSTVVLPSSQCTSKFRIASKPKVSRARNSLLLSPSFPNASISFPTTTQTTVSQHPPPNKPAPLVMPIYAPHKGQQMTPRVQPPVKMNPINSPLFVHKRAIYSPVTLVPATGSQTTCSRLKVPTIPADAKMLHKLEEVSLPPVNLPRVYPGVAAAVGDKFSETSPATQVRQAVDHPRSILKIPPKKSPIPNVRFPTNVVPSPFFATKNYTKEKPRRLTAPILKKRPKEIETEYQ